MRTYDDTFSATKIYPGKVSLLEMSPRSKIIQPHAPFREGRVVAEISQRALGRGANKFTDDIIS